MVFGTRDRLDRLSLDRRLLWSGIPLTHLFGLAALHVIRQLPI